MVRAVGLRLVGGAGEDAVSTNAGGDYRTKGNKLQEEAQRQGGGQARGLPLQGVRNDAKLKRLSALLEVLVLDDWID